MKKVIIYYNHAKYSGVISHYVYSANNNRSNGVFVSFNYENQPDFPDFFNSIRYI